MKKPIVKTGYLVCQVVVDDYNNIFSPDRVFMDENEAKEFVSRNIMHEIQPVPVIFEWVEVGDEERA